MYLGMGEYGGKRYISEATFKEFTRTQFPELNNRRALGFDKPNLVYTGDNNNTAKDAGPTASGIPDLRASSPGWIRRPDYCTSSSPTVSIPPAIIHDCII